jgi:hypothetical protein
MRLYSLRGSKDFFKSPGDFCQIPSIIFPSIVIKKSLFDNFGNFNEEYKACPDIEWLLRLNRATSNLKVYCSPNLVTNFRLGGNSDVKYY